MTSPPGSDFLIVDLANRVATSRNPLSRIALFFLSEGS